MLTPVSNIVAYTISSTPPRPFRFKSTSLRFQVPGLHFPEFLLKSRFIRDMAGSDTWKTSMNILHNIRTWARRTIWGDRVRSGFSLFSCFHRTDDFNQLFLQFQGPTTILVQSRANRVRDILSDREVNEIADTPAGATFDTINRLEDGTTGPHHKSDYQIAAEEAVSEAPVPSRSVEQLTQELAGVSRNIAIIRDGKVEFERAGSTSQESKRTV